MELSTSQLAGIPVIRIRGEIDHGNASTLSTAIDDVLDADQHVVLLDVTQVDYMDSGGISVLLSALRRLRERGWLGIINPNTNVRRLIQIVGLALDSSFRVFDDDAAAEQALRETART
mgnify:CR=1 FL=1